MNDVLLIGVDGGATEVKAHVVACDDVRHPATFALRPESAARVYPRVPGFEPLPVAEQLAQRAADRIQLSPGEIEQGRLWVAAAGAAIVDVVRQARARRVLVGMGMPGLKTPDARGIWVSNNGPRVPHYLELLEQCLRSAGVELAAPVAALGSDADYCGLGEEYAAEGLFRDVPNAYYLGGGTGLADALKLRGRLVPFDQAQSWIMKAWQMPSALGPTFEKLVSASSLNRVYGDLASAATGYRTGRSEPGRPVAPARYPELDAVRGQPPAQAWLDAAALVLAELIFERLWTIRNGRPDAPHRGEAYARLNPEHEFRGLLLDRVVIGQRIGLIYGDPPYRAAFGAKLDAALAAFIAASGDAEMAAQYVGAPSRSGGRARPKDEAGDGTTAPALNPGLVCASRLRAAPALGAAVAAVQALAPA